jgi:hypothetical protein
MRKGSRNSLLPFLISGVISKLAVIQVRTDHTPTIALGASSAHSPLSSGLILDVALQIQHSPIPELIAYSSVNGALGDTSNYA